MRKFCVKQNLIRYIYRSNAKPRHSELAEESARTPPQEVQDFINVTQLFGSKHNKRSKPTHDRNPSCAWCGYALISRQARNDGDWALLFYIFLAIIYNKRLCLYAHHFDRSAERAERRNPGEPPHTCKSQFTVTTQKIRVERLLGFSACL